MHRRILIARPRLDCSFKPGLVPEVEGPPRNAILERFGQFLDRLEAYHIGLGDETTVLRRALWQFELDEMQMLAAQYDRVYFPHKLRRQFPIGRNAFYYKNAPLAEYVTVDPAGWGASLSFLPPPLVHSPSAWDVFRRLAQRIDDNKSIFQQPPLGPPPVSGPYDLFVCQLPHDETIQFHADVTVERALTASIGRAETLGRKLLVKGHPANPRSMEPLKALATASPAAVWSETDSIHTCLRGADRVYLVNSGAGIEAMLHDKSVIRFGHAEYDCVTALADLAHGGLEEVEDWRHSTGAYAAFLAAYLERCIDIDDPSSYGRCLDPTPS